MLRLHESDRRWLCRTAFIALGIVPTLCVAAFATWRATSAHRRAYERAITAHTGFTASISRVEHTAPSVVLLHGVELVDRETGAPAARARLVEATWSDSRLFLTASQPEIEAAFAARWFELILRRLRQEPPLMNLEVRFSAQELTWRAGDRAQTFTQVESRLAPGELGQEAELAFHLVDAPSLEASEPAQMRLARQTDGGAVVTRFDFATGGAALPTSIFAPLADGSRLLGERSRFRGRFWADDLGDGWTGELSGHLLDVDLARLVSDRFPHKLSGLADVEITTARLAKGRLVEADGRLTAGPGVVGQSLVESLRLHLGLSGDAALHDVDQLRYSELAAGFHILDGELSLVGHCGSGARGSLLVGGQHSYLVESRERTAPIARLITALVPASELLVPASRATDAMLRVLPLSQAGQPSTWPQAASPSISQPPNDSTERAPAPVAEPGPTRAQSLPRAHPRLGAALDAAPSRTE